MKTSNKILFISGLVIVIIVLASVIGSRIFLNKVTNTYKSEDLNYSNIEQEHKEFINFTGLHVTGDWNITLISGNSYNISINGRTEHENLYKIEKKGSTLFLTENTQPDINRKLTAIITMPEIKEIYSEGGLKLNISDFIEPELILNLTGGSWVDGSGCKFENLYLTGAGAINLDFDNILTDNAELQLAGVGYVELNMGGGSLSGNAFGAMNIEYDGTAKEEIKVAGLANLSRRD